jgi:hypothetical protein
MNLSEPQMDRATPAPPLLRYDLTKVAQQFIAGFGVFLTHPSRKGRSNFVATHQAIGRRAVFQPSLRDGFGFSNSSKSNRHSV